MAGVKRTWVWGNTKEGYSVQKTKETSALVHGEPWLSEVWLDGKVVRHDYFKTKAEAVDYVRGRKESHRGKYVRSSK